MGKWMNGYLEKLAVNRKENLAAGGKERIKVQHQLGKLTARERIELLADPGPILAAAREDTGQPTEDLRFAFERMMSMLAGGIDATTEHESFRAIGDTAARDGLRAAYVLDRYLSLAWATWAAVETIQTAGRDDVHAFGDRLLRGGAWNNNQWNTRCANRNRNNPDNWNNNVGFRVAE